MRMKLRMKHFKQWLAGGIGENYFGSLTCGSIIENRLLHPPYALGLTKHHTMKTYVRMEV